MKDKSTKPPKERNFSRTQVPTEVSPIEWQRLGQGTPLGLVVGQP